MLKLRQKGKFAPKGDENRAVRSIRATDATWKGLQAIANDRRVSTADVLEWMVQEWQVDHQVMEMLTNALSLPANKGGAIKTEIKAAIALLGGES